MFLKYISPQDQAEIHINKDKIKFIENLSTENSLQPTKLTLNIHFAAEQVLHLIFDTQAELNGFLQKATE